MNSLAYSAASSRAAPSVVDLNWQHWRPLLVGLVVLAFSARHFALRYGDPDLGGRLAVGRMVLVDHTLPYQDPFAYTPTLAKWIDHEWFTGVVFYALDRLGGDAALLWTKTVLGIGMLWWVWRTARISGADPTLTWLFLALLMPVFGYGMMPRAQLFTYFFFAFWLYLLESDRLRDAPPPVWYRSRLVLLPATMIPWANFHGGFLAGLGLLFLYAVAAWSQPARCRRLGYWLVLATAASLINPYGLDYWIYLVDAVTMQRPGINEWDPVPWEWSYAQFWLLVALTLAGMARSIWLKRPWLSLLVLAVPLWMALDHARHMPLLAIVAGGLLPALLLPRQNPAIATPVAMATTGLAAWLCSILLGGLALWQCYGMMILDGPAEFVLPETPTAVGNMITYPVRNMRWARQQQLRGNLAVPFNWGEYAIWNLYPNCRVSIDGRYETVYPQATTEMVTRFFEGGTGWRELLDRHPTDFVLAPLAAPVNQRLAVDPAWRELQHDDASVLWGRAPVTTTVQHSNH